MTTGPRLPTDRRFAPPTPFARLLWAHAASAAADGCIAVSLAGSIFFEGPASGSREKVLLYLLVTMAPFLIVAPILGPALDRTRGGRRLLVVLSLVGRGLLALALARFITKDGSEALLVYPLAFSVLVLQKGYSVAKSSLVPALVENDGELVRANSRLALISNVATPVGAGPAALLSWAFDARWSLVLGFVLFLGAAVLAVKIPRVAAAPRRTEEVELEQEELHQPSILLAGSAMTVLRAAVGFLVCFTLFSLRDDVVALGAVGAMSMIGAFVGNFIAPLLRERIREETILASAIAAAALGVLLGGLMGGTIGFVLGGFAIAVGAAAGKIGFDSLLQRDGPDAVRGRAFARFETQFQFGSGIGALLGIISVDGRVGLLILGLTVALAGLSYIAALRAARGRVYRTTIRPKVVDKVFDRAKTGIAERRRRAKGERRQRAASKRSARRPSDEGDTTRPSRPRH